jgi:hypothetical protein
MPFLTRPWTRKPPGGPIGLDSNNPLTTGIVSCIPLIDGYGPPIDIVANPIHINSGVATWSSGLLGPSANAWSFTNASTADLGVSVSGVFSVAALFNIITLPGSGASIFGRTAYTSETVNSGWDLQITSTPVYSFIISNNNGFASYGLAGVTAPTLGNHMLVGTNNGTNLRCLYVDGKLDATINANPIPLTTTGLLRSNGTETSVYLSVIWNRVLSVLEVQQLYVNPWQMFRKSNIMLTFPSVQPAWLPYKPWAQLAPILAQ